MDDKLEIVRHASIPDERADAFLWLTRQLRKVAKTAEIAGAQVIVGYDFDSDTFMLKMGGTKRRHRIDSVDLEDKQSSYVDRVLDRMFRT